MTKFWLGFKDWVARGTPPSQWLNQRTATSLANSLPPVPVCLNDSSRAIAFGKAGHAISDKLPFGSTRRGPPSGLGKQKCRPSDRPVGILLWPEQRAT